MSKQNNAKFTIWIPGGLSFEPIQPKYIENQSYGSLIFIKGYKGNESFSVELGFDSKTGPYVRLWDGKYTNDPAGYAGQFNIQEQLTLRRLGSE